MTTDTAIEQEIQAKGKTAARVTPADIEANIASEHYFTALDGVEGATGSWNGSDSYALGLITICVLVDRLLQQEAARLHKVNRMLGLLFQIALGPQQLHVIVAV